MEAADYLSAGLPELLDLLRATDIRELELQEGDVRVRVHRAELAEGEWILDEDGEIESVAETLPKEAQVTAPLVGTFYRAANPGAPPLVSEGSRVEDDTVVGIIEALQVLTEVEAGCRGEVVSVLATDGQPVEYGQPLFEVRLSG